MRKSICCNGSVRLFGVRRRQCALCKKTWRVWKKKRGRKRNRLGMDLLFRYFEGHLFSFRLEKRTLSARLRFLLQKFNKKTPWPEVPKGQLIAIADGLIEFFKGEKYTIYFILVRGIDASKAFILPPYLRAGGEVAVGWHEAFSRLPDEIFDRIAALVCDGHGGLVYLAKEQQLILQRCHFHLLAQIAHNASFGHLNRTRDVGLKVKKLVEIVLYQKDPFAVQRALEVLQDINRSISSKKLKTVISGFLRHHEDFRTYLDFPQYFLPTTSNSAEFLNAQIRDLQYRARGFRTPESLFAWVIGFCKYQKSVTCRGKNQPN